VCRLKISASAVELGFEDDFWDGRDSVFINSLSVMSILSVQKMSASDVELGFLDDFWVPGISFSLTVSEAAVVCVD
jgi:ethanolamine utilization microcompartment shell protein EutS